MPIPEDYHQALDDVCNRLASETVLAQVGRDDGLIPAYSLLSDLVSATVEDPVLHAPAVHTRGLLDALLDAAKPFDEPTLNTLRTLVEWLGKAVDARVSGKPVPEWTVSSAPSHSKAQPEVAIEHEVAFEEQVLDLNMAENAELLTEFHAEAIQEPRGRAGCRGGGNN